MIATAHTNRNPMLVPEREAAYRLEAVYETVIDGCREELVLAFNGANLRFRPDPDDDSLEIRFEDSEFRPSGRHRLQSGSAFDSLGGAELGWSWLAVNQQGYCDTALLSFGVSLIPAVIVHVIGSSITVLGVDPKVT